MGHSVLHRAVRGMALGLGVSLLFAQVEVHAQLQNQPDPNTPVKIYHLEDPEQYYSDTVGAMYTAAADEVNKTNNGPQPQQGTNAVAPGQPGAQDGSGVPFMQPEQPEPEIIYQYDKKAVEGFYGVPLPQRLFNNVPSDW